MGWTPIRVGQLNSYIGRVLKTDPLLSDLSVIGEISNLKFHGSGHVYFSLKDDTSKINCFLSSRILPQITCPLEEGLEVIATGHVSVYERGGYYSLQIMDLESGGLGQLAVRFQQLKEKLDKEGLFDPAHKKPLPDFPHVVAVVTSPTGAAVRDVLKTLTDRNDFVKVLICPVLVQGPAAARDIASAIDEINRDHPEADVIIAGRGGGSTEELWAFNEEVVARSIYRSQIPVISAVGHETDFTIADFTADVRAQTPTAAAVLAVPDTAQLRQYLDSLHQEMTADLRRLADTARHRLEAASPSAFAAGIRTRIEYEQMHLDHLLDGMKDRLREHFKSWEHRIDLARQVLEAASPFEILGRGYAMIRDEKGDILRSIDEFDAGRKVEIQMHDGSAEAQLTSLRKEKLL